MSYKCGLEPFENSARNNLEAFQKQMYLENIASIIDIYDN